MEQAVMKKISSEAVKFVSILSLSGSCRIYAGIPPQPQKLGLRLLRRNWAWVLTIPRFLLVFDPLELSPGRRSRDGLEPNHHHPCKAVQRF